MTVGKTEGFSDVAGRIRYGLAVIMYISLIMMFSQARSNTDYKAHTLHMTILLPSTKVINSIFLKHSAFQNLHLDFLFI